MRAGCGCPWAPPTRLPLTTPALSFGFPAVTAEGSSCPAPAPEARRRRLICRASPGGAPSFGHRSVARSGGTGGSLGGALLQTLSPRFAAVAHLQVLGNRAGSLRHRLIRFLTPEEGIVFALTDMRFVRVRLHLDLGLPDRAQGAKEVFLRRARIRLCHPIRAARLTSAAASTTGENGCYCGALHCWIRRTFRRLGGLCFGGGSIVGGLGRALGRDGGLLLLG
mmetsp:Transcript_35295/g.76927  ORF Transcript_35295/g.76927 Transcript_35295/m.76927 type:complete len:223 (+) Transcript_35295:522-1190(+)